MRSRSARTCSPGASRPRWSWRGAGGGRWRGAVRRNLPGALGDEHSAVEESFSEALEGGFEYPHYTRPASYRGWDVPEVLLSGHHAQVGTWRVEQSRRRSGGG